MSAFTSDNTRGYSASDLRELNDAWDAIEKILMRDYKEESVTCVTLECYLKNRQDKLLHKFDSGERGQQLIDSVTKITTRSI